MSQERSQFRVLQNGNPFADAKQQLAPQDVETVLDIGANVGDVCEHMLANFPAARIHAFEPDVACYESLAARFSGEGRVIPVKLGLSDRKSRKKMYCYAESGLNSLSSLAEGSQEFLAGYGVQAAGTQQVELTTLDEYCRAQRIDRVDFLKMDVQGWELHCLRGAARMLSAGKIGAIYVEVNFVPIYEGQIYYEDVALMLRDFGFRLFSLYAQSFNEGGQLCWADALFLRADDLPIRGRSMLDRLLRR